MDRSTRDRPVAGSTGQSKRGAGHGSIVWRARGGGALSITLGSAGISTSKKASSGSAGLVAVVPWGVEAHVVKHTGCGQAGLERLAACTPGRIRRRRRGRLLDAGWNSAGLGGLTHPHPKQRRFARRRKRSRCGPRNPQRPEAAVKGAAQERRMDGWRLM